MLMLIQNIFEHYKCKLYFFIISYCQYVSMRILKIYTEPPGAK